MPIFHHYFRHNKKTIIAKSVFLIPSILTPFTIAHSQQNDAVEQLEEITVTTNAEDISSNSKIVKTTEQLEKQQVNNIRDLVRYDAGISVVEQNRGGTTGFAIRGVDKNRVAITVDGLPQIQGHLSSYGRGLQTSPGSGARNEVELENISRVEINKGGQSLQSGSGALGGAVNFRTKHIDDVLEEGEKFALTSKTAYNSRNSSFMQSLGTAFNVGKVKGLFQHTYRNGKETKIHDDAMNQQYQIRRLGTYLENYDLGSKTPNTPSRSKFYKCKDCTEPFPRARQTQFSTLSEAISWYKSLNGGRDLTQEELEEVKQRIDPSESLSAKTFTGPERIAPDPLKTKSHSSLIRLEYEITPNQSFGAIFEDTKQQYATRDMRIRSYFPGQPIAPSFADPRKKRPPFPRYEDYECLSCGEDGFFNEKEYKEAVADFRKKLKEFQEYQNQPKSPEQQAQEAAWDAYDQDKANFKSNTQLLVPRYPEPNSGGVYLDDINIGELAPIAWTHAHFSKEIHRKQRQSLYYSIEPKNKWADKLELNLDLQKLSINSDYRDLRCSKYPIVDKNCRASRDKPGSSEHLNNVRYTEKNAHLGFKYDNSFNIDPITYQINIAAGGSLYTTEQDHYNYLMAYGGLPSALRNNYSETYVESPLGRIDERDLLDRELCAGGYCSYKIKGKTLYYGLYNQIAFGRYLDIGGGFMRYRDSLKGNKDYLKSRTYKNTVYRFNAALKPFDFLNIAYNYSTGFRNPSAQEIHGTLLEIRDSLHLKPETSTHHDVSMTLNGDWGFVEANKFVSHYKNLISIATHEKTTIRQEYNFSNATIEGYGIRGQLNLHAITDIIPPGFSTNFSYEKTKPKKASKISDDLRFGELYPFDAIQPARLIVGLNYDAPSEKWGTSLIMTYSKAKDPSELVTERFYAKDPNHPINTLKVTHIKTKPWKTLDWLAYYNIKKNVTLNLGIYNLLNEKYSSWESVRRSSATSVHSENPYGDIARYAAPGRNYYMSLNMKF